MLFNELVNGIVFGVAAVLLFVIILQDKTRWAEDKLSQKMRLILVFIGALSLSILMLYKYFFG